MFEKDEDRAERELKGLLQETEQPKPQSQGIVTPPPETAPETVEDNGYKQRYLTLQGMMRADKEKWQMEKQQLQQEIVALKSRPASRNDSVEVEDNYRSEHVTDEVRQSLAYRRMAELNGQRHTEIHFESLAMMNPKKEETPVNDTGDFYANLDRLSRSWRQLNSNPDFLAFLSQVAPYSGGMTLRDKLNQAVQNNDAAAAAQFFIDFSERTIQPPTTQQKPDGLIVPPKRGSSAHVAAEANQGKVYTKAEWDAGWKQLELGNLTSKMAAELEADLTNAPGEGRVVG